MKIAIDAGHGKDGDPGAVGPYGTKEAEITQALALQLGNFFLALGQEAFLCDRSLYASERAVQAKDQGCDILLSLHCNAGGTQAQGIEAWFSHGNADGQELAQRILSVLISETGEPSRGVKDDADWRPASDPTWTGGMGVLRNFPGPAVLIELLFISNPQEEKLLASREFLEKCAHAIACGVLDFLNSWKKGNPGVSNPSQALDPFPDLSPTLWEGKARKMVLALRELGIITGYEDGTFRPDQPISRMEAASLIYRTLAYLGKLPPLE
ncbi:MAG: N-acetylmuramoyl-L-alanine amidase [Caldiserica bacterium]|nr:N-acetylmuramoyl-L-alanine amidase [Caldisericota bacterium]